MKQNREQHHECEKDVPAAEMELEPGEGLVFQLTPAVPAEKKTNILKRTLASNYSHLSLSNSMTSIAQIK